MTISASRRITPGSAAAGRELARPPWSRVVVLPRFGFSQNPAPPASRPRSPVRERRAALGRHGRRGQQPDSTQGSTPAASVLAWRQTPRGDVPGFRAVPVPRPPPTGRPSVTPRSYRPLWAGFPDPPTMRLYTDFGARKKQTSRTPTTSCGVHPSPVRRGLLSRRARAAALMKRAPSLAGQAACWSCERLVSGTDPSLRSTSTRVRRVSPRAFRDRGVSSSSRQPWRPMCASG